MHKDPEHESPQETSARLARTLFGAGADSTSRRRAVLGWLLGAPLAAVLIPALFWLRFGYVDGFAWGFAVFLAVYCLAAAVGVNFQPKTAFHTPVPMTGGWGDRLGALWLVACAFGPFLGWIATSALPLTPANWRLLYGLRFFLAAVLPVLTALPLWRYTRGGRVWVATLLLITITALPVWTAVDAGRDLWAGPVERGSGLVMPFTGQELRPG